MARIFFVSWFIYRNGVCIIFSAINASTAESPTMVNDFLSKLASELKVRSAQDFASMSEMKRADTKSEAPLAAWDTPYYTAKYKKQFLQVSSSEFTPYFSLGGCMEGLNNLMKCLYGITLENTEMGPGETWAAEVYKLAVVHENEGVLGHIYCDLHDRPGKPNQDCHFTIQGGKSLPDGTYQVRTIVCAIYVCLIISIFIFV